MNTMITSADSYFDGVNITQVLTDTMLTSHQNQRVCHRFSFTDALGLTVVRSAFYEGITENRLVNGIDVVVLNESAVFLHKDFRYLKITCLGLH